jgi:hypothetical protein
MTKEELKEHILKNIFSEKGKLKYSSLNKIDINIIYEIEMYTDFINTSDIKERIYYILNNISQTVICPCCKTNIPNFISIKHGYRTTCSNKCSTIYSANKCYETKIKNNSFEKACLANKKTKLERYGNENFNNRQKSKLTCLEKYGVDNPLKAKEILDKVKSTNIEKYGFENVFQSEFIKDKIKLTNVEKYGVENYSQTGLNETSGYKWKDYITTNSNILKVQGHEPKLLDEIFLEYHEDELITERKDMPEIWYLGKDNKTHRYFPDIFIPKTNTIYEVKSEYTLNIDLETNNLKFQAVKDAGFNFVLKVY